MKSRTEILVPFAAIQAVPIAVIAWYRLQRYAWYRYSAIVIDSNEARNVAFKIIETFTEHQQLLRHIMVAEYKDEYGKKKEEAYMEDKLKHILARSSACI